MAQRIAHMIHHTNMAIAKHGIQPTGVPPHCKTNAGSKKSSPKTTPNLSSFVISVLAKLFVSTLERFSRVFVNIFWQDCCQ